MEEKTKKFGAYVAIIMVLGITIAGSGCVEIDKYFTKPQQAILAVTTKLESGNVEISGALTSASISALNTPITSEAIVSTASEVEVADTTKFPTLQRGSDEINTYQLETYSIYSLYGVTEGEVAHAKYRVMKETIKHYDMFGNEIPTVAKDTYAFSTFAIELPYKATKTEKDAIIYDIQMIGDPIVKINGEPAINTFMVADTVITQNPDIPNTYNYRVIVATDALRATTINCALITVDLNTVVTKYVLSPKLFDEVIAEIYGYDKNELAQRIDDKIDAMVSGIKIENDTITITRGAWSWLTNLGKAYIADPFVMGATLACGFGSYVGGKAESAGKFVADKTVSTLKPIGESLVGKAKKVGDVIVDKSRDVGGTIASAFRTNEAPSAVRAATKMFQIAVYQSLIYGKTTPDKGALTSMFPNAVIEADVPKFSDFEYSVLYERKDKEEITEVMFPNTTAIMNKKLSDYNTPVPKHGLGETDDDVYNFIVNTKIKDLDYTKGLEIISRVRAYTLSSDSIKISFFDRISYVADEIQEEFTNEYPKAIDRYVEYYYGGNYTEFFGDWWSKLLPYMPNVNATQYSPEFQNAVSEYTNLTNITILPIEYLEVMKSIDNATNVKNIEKILQEADIMFNSIGAISGNLSIIEATLDEMAIRYDEIANAIAEYNKQIIAMNQELFNITIGIEALQGEMFYINSTLIQMQSEIKNISRIFDSLFNAIGTYGLALTVDNNGNFVILDNGFTSQHIEPKITGIYPTLPIYSFMQDFTNSEMKVPVVITYTKREAIKDAIVNITVIKDGGTIGVETFDNIARYQVSESLFMFPIRIEEVGKYAFVVEATYGNKTVKSTLTDIAETTVTDIDFASLLSNGYASMTGGQSFYVKVDVYDKKYKELPVSAYIGERIKKVYLNEGESKTLRYSFILKHRKEYNIRVTVYDDKGNEVASKEITGVKLNPKNVENVNTVEFGELMLGSNKEGVLYKF